MPTFRETCQPHSVPSDLITQQSTPTRGFLKQRRPRTELEQRPGNCILSVSDSLNVRTTFDIRLPLGAPSVILNPILNHLEALNVAFIPKQVEYNRSMFVCLF